MRISGIPERPRVGLGGEGVLRTTGREAGATAVIVEALERGIRYFDSARAYADSELYHGRVWGERSARRDGIYLTSKSASVSAKIDEVRQARFRLCDEIRSRWAPPIIAVFGRPRSSRFRFDGGYDTSRCS